MSRALAAGLTVTAALGCLLLPVGAVRSILAIAALWVLPASAWYRLLAGDRSERLVSAAAFAMLIHALAVLVLSYLPGPLTATQILLVTTLLTLLALAIGCPRPNARENARSWSVALLLVLLFALSLRGPGLGYKEVQGDEGIILARAAAALQGDNDELFLHQKGPIELLLPMAQWGISGAASEFWLRLPFLWGGLLSVAALGLLARRWGTDRSGIFASLLFAICGFGIAFSRIIQYQVFVLLWGTLALLFATRYRDDGGARALLLGTLFLAGAILAHYDGILVAPVFGWLVIERWRHTRRLESRPIIAALLLGAGVLALFYLPFALHPSFGSTISYLISDRIGAGGGDVAQWSGGIAWQMATFYNSTWYVLGVGLMAILGSPATVRARNGVPSLLYFTTPLVFYLLVVSDPRTHIYTVFPGACILAGLALGRAWSCARQRGNVTTAALMALVLSWTVLSTVYVYLLFVDFSPERQRTWQENRPLPALFPVTWQSPPLYGLFGFPHQAGWRLAQGLVTEDMLPYASNEEEEITNWYMTQAPRTHCANFNSFLMVANAQDAIPYEPAWLDGLHVAHEVEVAGQPAMQIYTRREVSFQRWEATGHDNWITPDEMVPETPAGIEPIGLMLGDAIELLGYQLDVTAARPGGQLVVTLFWQSQAPIAESKQVFVHLFDGEIRAQADSAPECNINPTTRWEPGQIIPDPHVVALPQDMPAGAIPIMVGMYDLVSGERLVVSNGAQDSIYLTDVEIKP